MTFKHGGYYADGSIVVYGFNDSNNKVAVFRGYVDWKNNTISLYPKKILMPTTEDVGKRTIPIFNVEKE